MESKEILRNQLSICGLQDEKIETILQKVKELLVEYSDSITEDQKSLINEIETIKNRLTILNRTVEDFKQKVEKHLSEEKDENKPVSLANTSIAFLGDSVCEGYGWKKEIGDMSKNLGWAKIIQENNPTATIYNYAVGGSTYCWRSNAPSIGSQMLTMRKMADTRKYNYIILNGCINDTFTNTTVGSLSKSFEIPDSAGTGFYGGIEVMIYNFKKYWPDAKIGLILPTKTRWYVTQMLERIKMLEEICHKWNVPILDLWRNASLDPEKDEINNTYFYNKDGVHPKQAGYRQFLAPAIEKWMKDGMPDQSKYGS